MSHSTKFVKVTKTHSYCTPVNPTFVRHVLMKVGSKWCNSCIVIFATRKRSLGQGNVFTPICHSVHGMRGGGGGGYAWQGSVRGMVVCMVGHA